MKRKVAIVSGLQIIDNPRVVKEADAVAELGYDVEVLAAIHNTGSIDRIAAMLDGRRWRHTPVVDLTQRRPLSVARHALMRTQSKLVRSVRRRLGWEHPAQLGFMTGALCRAALASRADLYSIHLEQALWTGKSLVSRNIPIRVDFEDWYSEDGLPADRVLRPVELMKRIEQELLNRAVHVTAPSRAMAETLAQEHECATPAIVYNSFPTEDRARVDGRITDRRSTAVPSITWFSQTIGPGRGLETLISALSLLDCRFELHLRGKARAGYVEELLILLTPEKRSSVFLHAQVPQSELLSRLVEHDIGYCGELSDCRSRDLTITNKILEYMRAGLAIMASDTAGQREVAAKVPHVVSIFKQGDAQSLAAALYPLLTEPERLRHIKGLSWRDFDGHFGWDQSKRVIQSQVSGFFERGGPVAFGMSQNRRTPSLAGTPHFDEAARQ